MISLEFAAAPRNRIHTQSSNTTSLMLRDSAAKANQHLDFAGIPCIQMTKIKPPCRSSLDIDPPLPIRRFPGRALLAK